MVLRKMQTSYACSGRLRKHRRSIISFVLKHFSAKVSSINYDYSK